MVRVNGINGKMNWLELLALKRHSNASNVFLLETDDPERLQQLLENVKELLIPEKEKREEYSIYLLSLQTGQIKTIQGDTADVSGPAAVNWLLQKASRDPTIVIMAWVVTKEHVKRVLDALLYASQSAEYFKPRSVYPEDLPSSFIVFTFTIDIWPQEALRFFATIEIEPSTKQERAKLIRQVVAVARKKGYQVKANIDEAVNASAGLTLHDIITATVEAIRLSKPVDASAYRSYKQELLRRYALEYVEPKRGFESVGGYDYLKSWLYQNVINFYREPKLAEEYGLTPPRGLLFFGPPGTGKTWLTKAVAREMGLPMVKLSAADLLRGIVGESEQRARKIARIVESMAPIVVFIDEADQLFRSRAGTVATDSGVSQRVQNILLDWLGDEDRKSFIVMATNYLEQFDFAAVRAGRIDYAVPILLPDAYTRKQILKLHLEILPPRPKVPVELDEEKYTDLARKTVGYTGAELAQVARQAKIFAATEGSGAITLKHVERAIRQFRIDVEQRMRMVQRIIDSAEKLETVLVPKMLLSRAKQAIERETNDGFSSLRARV